MTDDKELEAGDPGYCWDIGCSGCGLKAPPWGDGWRWHSDEEKPGGFWVKEAQP